MIKHILSFLFLSQSVFGQSWSSVQCSDSGSLYSYSGSVPSIDINSKGIVFAGLKSGEVDYYSSLNLWQNYNNVSNNSATEHDLLIGQNDTVFMALIEGKNLSLQKILKSSSVTVGPVNYITSQAQNLRLSKLSDTSFILAYSDLANGKALATKIYHKGKLTNLPSFGAASTEFELSEKPGQYPVIVYKQDGSGILYAKQFDGSSWKPLGGAISSSWVYLNYDVEISDGGTIHILYDLSNSNGIYIQKWNGASWANVKFLGVPADKRLEGCKINFFNQKLTLIYGIGSYNSMTNSTSYVYSVAQLENDAWKNIGQTFKNIENAELKSLGTDLYLAYMDPHWNNKPVVQKLTDNQWVLLETKSVTPKNTGASIPAIAINSKGIPHVLFRDTDNSNKASVLRFVNNKWEYAGNPGFNSGNVLATAIAINSKDEVYAITMSDTTTSNDVHAIHRLEGTQWKKLYSASQFNSSNISLQNARFSNKDSLYYVLNIGFDYAVWKYDQLKAAAYSTFSISSASSLDYDLDKDQNLHVVYTNYSNTYKAYVLKVTKGVNTFLANPLVSAGGATRAFIRINNNNEPYVFYGDMLEGERHWAVKYSANKWVKIGTNLATEYYDIVSNIRFDNANMPVLSTFNKGIVTIKLVNNVWTRTTPESGSNIYQPYNSLAYAERDSVKYFVYTNSLLFVKGNNPSTVLSISETTSQTSEENQLKADWTNNTLSMSEHGNAIVYDAKGIKVLEKEGDTFNLKDLNSGIYVIKFHSLSGKPYVVKVYMNN